MAWQLWCRHRIGLPLSAAVLLMMAILCWSLAGLLPDRNNVVPLMMFPCAAVLIYLLSVFSFSFDARIDAPESGFPARMFTLPVPTRQLVAWPMLLAATAMAGWWFACVAGVLWPLGFRPALLWPAAAAAASLAWLQALAWSPFGASWVRSVVAIVVLTALTLSPGVLFALQVHAAILTSLLLLLLVAAYPVALAGVARARRGDTPRWRLPRWGDLLRPRENPRRPFAGAARAQAWLEWRRHGVALPVLQTGLLLLSLPILGSEAGVEEWAASGMLPWLTAAVGQVGPTAVLLAYVLLLPWLLALTAGGELGRMSADGMSAGMAVFVATRPVSSGALALSKFRLTVRCTLVCWALLLLVLAGWVVVGGRWSRLTQTPFVQHIGMAGAVGRACLVVLALVLMTWLQLLRGLWVGMAGRTTLKWAALVAGLGFLTAAGLLAQGFSRRPQAWDALCAALPWALGAAVVLKFLGAAVLFRAVRRRGLWSSRTCCSLFLAFLAVTAALVAIGRTLVPAEVLSLAWIGVVAVLLVPLNRVLAAPLAVAWNRHR
jgi:hypothetical protein